jgi:hypothetical protein
LFGPQFTHGRGAVILWLDVIVSVVLVAAPVMTLYGAPEYRTVVTPLCMAAFILYLWDDALAASNNPATASLFQKRRKVMKGALIVFQRGQCSMRCRILDLSDTGALLPRRTFFSARANSCSNQKSANRVTARSCGVRQTGSEFGSALPTLNSRLARCGGRKCKTHLLLGQKRVGSSKLFDRGR